MPQGLKVKGHRLNIAPPITENTTHRSRYGQGQLIGKNNGFLCGFYKGGAPRVLTTKWSPATWSFGSPAAFSCGSVGHNNRLPCVKQLFLLGMSC
ncbi:hypothetical protein ANANG_G00251950 [Anguilla anguilla]|uniref:Uncharacterized protein n=1 Tax=Anguilla anguilla TaxID=7936 RepID=A0A9D3LSF4_ANGAN|nr:hypothetical protein ANANG_G00251950 [Anguilla anguilla]